MTRSRPGHRLLRSRFKQSGSARNYPGDPAHGEFYRDVGFDLPGAPWPVSPATENFQREYHRITGAGGRIV